MTKQRILVAWVGFADISGMLPFLDPETAREVANEYNSLGSRRQLQARQSTPGSNGDTASPAEKAGPNRTLLSQESFDEIHLLCTYPEKVRSTYARWLGRGVKIHKVSLHGGEVINYSRVYEETRKTLEQILGERDVRSFEVTYHPSSGTPTMAAILVLLGKTLYPGKFVQTHAGEVIHTEIPFDIMVDVMPHILGPTARAWQYLAHGPSPGGSSGFDRIVMESQAMRSAASIANKAALAGIGILLLGPTGSGKERFAEAIHAASRRTGNLEAVNCAAFPGNLLESELFGHVKGSFTGADRDYRGRFSKANKGTLFLDEIGEATLDLQAKLLRVLQPPDAGRPTLLRVRKVGGDADETVDVRVIAATNRDLLTEVQKGRFRADLYYRLAVITVRIPALCERRKDIPALANEFLDQANTSFRSTLPNFKDKHLSPSAMAFLTKQRWPGNVRQLQHVIRVAVLFSPQETLRQEDIQAALQYSPGFAAPETILNRPLGNGFRIDDLINDIQRQYLERARVESDGVKTRAAQLLGLKSYQALDSRLRALGVQWPSRGQSKHPR